MTSLPLLAGPACPQGMQMPHRTEMLISFLLPDYNAGACRTFAARSGFVVPFPMNATLPYRVSSESRSVLVPVDDVEDMGFALESRISVPSNVTPYCYSPHATVETWMIRPPP